MASGESAIEPNEAADPLVLALDVGSSSARALVYDAGGRMVRGWEVHRPYPVVTTSDGGVVVDADDLLALVGQCLDEILDTIRGRRKVAAIACDTFWHSLLGVDAHRRAVTPVYTWADTRSSEAAKQLQERLDKVSVQQRTGCVLHSSYWPAKLLWLRETQPKLVGQVKYWISFAEYLYLHVFGERRVSVSMASGTGIFDQRSCTWDSEVLEAVSLDQSRLSPLAEFSDVMTEMGSSFQRRWPALVGVPWYLPLGDGACSNVGSGGFCPEWLVLMVGTSGAIRVVREVRDARVPYGLWTYRVDRRRVVQGGALSDGGNVFAWLTHTLVLDPIPRLEEELSQMAPDSHGLTVLPFLAGERSPDWNPDARAAIVGMTLATRPVDMVRATIEAVAYRFGAVYDVLKEVIPPTRGIIGSGAGLIHSPAWLQIMTDVLGEPISVSGVPEASSRGAAILVLESLGVLKDLGTVPAPLGDRYTPDPARQEIYRTGRERQARLYELLSGDQNGPASGSRGEETHA